MDSRPPAAPEADAPACHAARPGVPGATPVLSTGSLFHLPLPDIAHIARAAGFAGLDLVMGSPKIAPGPAVMQAHALCPVRVVHAPFRNWSAWGGHMNAWRAAVDLAGSLLAPGGGIHVTLHPPAGTLRDAIQTRWFSRAVGLPSLLSAPQGVSLSLENLPWSSALLGGGGLFSRDSLDALLDQCREKGLGLTLDVCHLGVSGRDVLADLGRIQKQGGSVPILHVHFSDASGFTEHLPPGAGALPLGPFLAALGAGGYAGTVSLELDPAQLPEDETGQVRELSALRLGMERALCGCPPAAWSGGAADREGRSPMVAPALG